MRTGHEIDEAKRRVRMFPAASAKGRDVTSAILSLIEARPELTGWDWVHDVRVTSGEVETVDVDRVADALRSGGNVPCWTVFISHDRGLAGWCQVMDHQVPGRRHLVVPTPEAAERQLDVLRGLTS